MSKPVRFARQAREEVAQASRYYGQQRQELRIEFLAAVDEVVERMARHARYLGSPPGMDPALGVKRVFMQRFPYSVYFIELTDRFRVLAVAHSRQRPLYWRDRL